MAQIRLLRVDDFTGGLNLRADAFQLGANESPDLLNVDVDPRGGFAMRGGWQRLNTSAIGGIAAGSFAPASLFAWNGATPQLLLAANNKVFYATTTSFTDTTITTTAADGACFAPWSGSLSRVYVATGNAGQGYRWNGSTMTALTASATAAWQDSLASPTGTHMPKADHCASHVDRLFVANTVEDGTTYADRVRWSHPNFPESWRQVDYVDVVGGGSGITALVPFDGALLIFKRSSVWALYGYDTDTFQLVELTSAVGAQSRKAVCATESGLFFFSWPDGLFMFDGKQFVDMFDPLRPLIQANQINEAQLSKIAVSFVGRRLWLSLPQGGDASATYSYVMDPTINGAWVRYQGADGRGLATGCDFVTSTGTRFALMAHPTKAFVVKVDLPTFYQDDIDGTAANFSSYYSTRWQDAGNVSAKKMWRRPDMVLRQPSADTTLTLQAFHNWEEAVVRRTFSLLVDGGATGLEWAATGTEPDANPGWGEAAWGGPASGSQFERGGNLGLARSVLLKVSGPGGLPWAVNSITFKYNPRKVRA